MATTAVTVPHRAGLYLALLQLFFTLCWTVYAIYLPALAATAGIPRGAVVLLLMLDQAIFTIADFATGVASDKVSKVLGRLGYWAAAITLLSCAAFLALPFAASGGTAVFMTLTVIWAVTSSALRAPPLMLLGKYAAKPAIPWLAALAMLGYGLAGAAGPYLAVALRQQDPRWPFALASIALVLTSFGLVAVERHLANTAPVPAKAKTMAKTPLSRRAVAFGLALIVLALGYQLHFAINSAPLFLRFAKPSDLEYLMPIFWIGFNLAMLPASRYTDRIGAYPMMGVAALLGALAILATAAASSLEWMILAQAASGAAWGCILMAAFALAFSIGQNGHEGAMAGLLFSALALATFARMAVTASGLIADETFRAAIVWMPTACWIFAGAALIYAALSRTDIAQPSL
ncbi:MAG: MFS transporter [Pseudolabrys sp.]|nr:MFS transporter [Pseudolabrys sp.]